MRSRLSGTVVAALLLSVALPALAGAVPRVPASRFEAAEGCGCHAALVQTWRDSMHAQALTDPLYLYKLKQASKASKGALVPFCNSCHGPVAVMSGELSPRSRKNLSASSRDAVGCDFCHQVTGSARPVGNASWTIRADGTKRAQYKDAKSPYHENAYSRFHETAEFCGMCHDVVHPGNGIPLESAYSEWKAGPYAKQGITCQDCHMTPGPGVTKPNPGRAAAFGPNREHVYSMTFVGGNAALGPKDLAVERLRAAAAVTLEASRVVASGGSLRVLTRVENVGAGHYLPTGLTEVRQMWLEVVAVDRGGRELMRERHEYGTVLKDAKGRYPVELWEATGVQSDDRIPPKADSRDEWTAPMGDGPVTVSATLYYRSASEEMAKAAGVDVPTTEMAKATAIVYASAAQADAVVKGGLREDMRRAWLAAPGFNLALMLVGALLALFGIVAFALWRAQRD